MKPAPFEYHRPDTVTEAAALLAELGDDAKILAGGQSLTPMLMLRLAFFDHLIDISRLQDIRGIERQNGSLYIGAGTTDAAVGSSETVKSAVPLLERVTPYIGHFQIRARGTLGGSVAHADPAGEYPAVALALDAEMEALSASGRRTIAASEFFDGLWQSSLAEDEILVGVRFPVWSGRSGFAIEEFARRHGDFAIAGAVVALELDGNDVVTRCGVGLLGLGSTPERAHAAEAAVVGRPVGDITPEEFGSLAVSGLEEVPTDLQGSPEYRTRVGATMAARAFTSARSEALESTGAEHAVA